MGIRYGSLFSGVEAASLAWEGPPLNWIPAFFAEVDPFCCELLRQRWPTVPNLGDVTADDFVERARACGRIDVLIGGSPCQSFSTAGKRKGLDDDRGNLTIRFWQVASEIKPEWVVWENVPGVLSQDGGRAFGTVVGKVVDGGFVEFAWRVLDAQFAGVPQRRRRVFLVASSGAGRPETVLAESEGEGRNPAASGEAGTGVTGVAEAGVGAVVPVDMRQASRGGKLTNNRREGSSGGAPGTGIGELGDPSPTLADSYTPAVAFAENQRSEVRLTPVVSSLGVGGGKPGQGYPAVCHESGQGWWNQADYASTLRSEGENRPTRPTHVVIESDENVAVAFGGGNCSGSIDVTTTTTTTRTGLRLDFDTDTFVVEPTCVTGLRTHALTNEGADASEDGTGRGTPIICFRDERGRDCGDRAIENQSFPLHRAKGMSEQQIVAFSTKDDGRDAGETSPTLRSMNFDQSHLNGGGQVGVAMSFQERGDEVGRRLDVIEDQAYALTSPNGGGRGQERNVLTPQLIVRRLTPRECERLQGMPDDHTLVTYRKKPASDSVRYKAIGNSMAVPVIRQIGERLEMEIRRVRGD